jgi:hypothetical protein
MIDAQVLSETYSILKEYINARDRQAAADHLLSSLVDLSVSEQDLKEFCTTDKYLKQSYEDYFQDADAGDEEEEIDYDYDQDD